LVPKAKLSGSLYFIRAEVEIFITHKPYYRLSLSSLIAQPSGVFASHWKIVGLIS